MQASGKERSMIGMVGKYMMLPGASLMVALAAYEHGMICTPIALCISSAVCAGMALDSARRQHEELC